MNVTERNNIAEYRQKGRKGGFYTLPRHNLVVFEGLKTQGHERRELCLEFFINVVQTSINARFESVECLIVTIIQTLFFDHLTRPSLDGQDFPTILSSRGFLV